MQHILDHFWKILFVAALAVGGYYFFGQKEKRDRWEQTVKTFSTQLEFGSTDYKADPAESQGRYWKLMNYFYEVRNNLKDDKLKVKRPSNRDAEADPQDTETGLRWAVEEALEANGIPFESSVRHHYWTSLQENVKACDRLGLFATPANRLAMVKGESPTITKGAFQGEKAILTQRIPVVLARELRNHPMNFAIVPETIAGAVGNEVDEDVYRAASVMKDAGVILKKSYETVKQWYDQGNK